jgi:hypothetical protein
MATLAEIRAKLMAESQKQGNRGQSGGGDNAIFPHWRAPDNSTTVVRFLPDADTSNTFFWRERAVIKMPFSGIAGETDSKPVLVEVPCLEMYGEKDCPLLQEARGFYKLEKIEAAKGNLDKAKEYNDLGSRYWKKRSYLMQGFVVDTKFVEDRVPENPIRRFTISPSIFPLIPKALMDIEIPHLVTDYVNGLDFKITKTGGVRADYKTSGWARRERALSDAEMAAINQYGVFDLKSFLPKRPGEVELKVAMEMFEASLAGDAFDRARWGDYFRPRESKFGNNSDNDEEFNVAPVASRVTTSQATTVVESEEISNDVAVAIAVTAPSNNDAATRAHDILAKIRNRQPQ